MLVALIGSPHLILFLQTLSSRLHLHAGSLFICNHFLLLDLVSEIGASLQPFFLLLLLVFFKAVSLTVLRVAAGQELMHVPLLHFGTTATSVGYLFIELVAHHLSVGGQLLLLLPVFLFHLFIVTQNLVIPLFLCHSNALRCCLQGNLLLELILREDLAV